MLKKIYFRKIMVATLALFALFLIYLMPEKESTDYTLSYDNIEYMYTNVTEVVYLLDTNDYVARTTIMGCDCDVLETVKDVSKGLIIDGEKSHIIPNGFKPLIPNGTELLDVKLENKILTLNFSSELLEINEQYEEKMIESIVYTLTSIDGIDKIVILVEGKVLTNLPNSGKKLPPYLDKGYGINKSYSLTNTQNIDSYTVYYVSGVDDNKYYVPITKYVNKQEKDKIKIIIEELSTSPIYETNLMSYLNANVSLVDYTLENDVLYLNFNDAIFNNSVNNNILEEVIYTISLSVEDNYGVKEVVFLVNDEEIYKKS